MVWGMWEIIMSVVPFLAGRLGSSAVHGDRGSHILLHIIGLRLWYVLKLFA